MWCVKWTPIILILLLGVLATQTQGGKNKTASRNCFAVKHQAKSQKTLKAGKKVLAKVTSALKDRSCNHILSRAPNATSGEYTIYPLGIPNGLKVWCDMRNGKGWIVIVRFRKNDPDKANKLFTNHRNWEDYMRGFGNVRNDFYIGNEVIHLLTTSGVVFFPVTVRFDLWNVTVSHETVLNSNKKAHHQYAEFREFSIGSNSTNYKLTVRGYTGGTITEGNKFESHNGVEFSTHDNDNDQEGVLNCGVWFKTGWWFTGDMPCASPVLAYRGDPFHKPYYGSSVFELLEMKLLYTK